jgi:outer membrane protein assembly factor BamD (BamD/ComL family)
MLVKYRNTSQEPIFLQKLAESIGQSATMKFRIAQSGVGSKGKMAVTLKNYRETLQDQVAVLSDLIKKFPEFENLATCLYMRGKAHEEILDGVKEKLPAERDYQRLVREFPEAEEAIPAYMSLANFAIDANQHEKAIEYLNPVEKQPDSQYYPFALYKLAWSHYNLKHIDQALGYLIRNIRFYQKLQPTDTSDLALLENALQDVPVFYLEGYELKDEKYATQKAYPYFLDIEKGDLAGRMFLRYAKLLRAHGHDEDLKIWKSVIIDKEAKRSEALDVLLVVFEHQLNRRRYQDLEATTLEIGKLFRTSGVKYPFHAAQKLLLETAENFQQLMLKNKSSSGLTAINSSLAKIFQVFTEIVPADDPRVPQVHYNLAETLYEIRDYAQATTHYRWIVDRGGWKLLGRVESQPGNIADASLKAISSRYQYLKEKGVIPKDLTPKAATERKSEEEESKVSPEVREWVSWIDAHRSKAKSDPSSFEIEANRTLYHLGAISEALNRMEKFVADQPQSPLAIPQAALVLDSWITASKWDRVLALSEKYLDVKPFQKTEFKEKLDRIAQNAAAKLIESTFKSKEFEPALETAKKYLKRYPESERRLEILWIAAQSSLQLKRKHEALDYLNPLIDEDSKGLFRKQAVAIRSGLYEEFYEFDAASKDLAETLRLMPAAERAPRLREKLLLLTWLARDMGSLQKLLKNPEICREDLTAPCDRLQALIYLSQGTDARRKSAYSPKFARERAKDSPEENRAIWSLLALEEPQEYAFRDRLILVRQVASHWDKIDSLVKMDLAPLAMKVLPATIRLNRTTISEIAPLRASEKWIKYRIEIMQEIENAVAKLTKLPWNNIKALTLNEVADSYIDLASGLQKIPAPKDLSAEDLAAYEDMIRKIVVPFEEKGNEIRTKAFELASSTQIDEDSLELLTQSFAKDNPSQAKLYQSWPKRKLPAWDLSLLDSIDPDANWDEWKPHKPLSEKDRIKLSEKSPVEFLKYLYLRAVHEKRWSLASYYLQELTEKNALPSLSQAVARAYLYSSLGGRSEALQEWEEVLKLLPKDSRKRRVRAIEFRLDHHFRGYQTATLKKTIDGWVETFKKDYEEPEPSEGPRWTERYARP